MAEKDNVILKMLGRRLENYDENVSTTMFLYYALQP
jgi:hypothetical protein